MMAWLATVGMLCFSEAFSASISSNTSFIASKSSFSVAAVVFSVCGCCIGGNMSFFVCGDGCIGGNKGRLLGDFSS